MIPADGSFDCSIPSVNCTRLDDRSFSMTFLTTINNFTGNIDGFQNPFSG